MAAEFGLIGTIGDDDDVPILSESTDSDAEPQAMKRKKKKKHTKPKHEDFNDNFSFTEQGGATEWDMDLSMLYSKKKTSSMSTTLDDKIAKLRKEKKKKQKSEGDSSKENIDENGDGENEEDNVDADVEESEESDSSDGEEIKEDTIKVKQRKGKKRKMEEEVPVEKVTFSEDVSSYDENMSFQDMNLSRPLLKALSTMKFDKPTPIQAACVPIALLAKDICACAVTGSGKTAAFMLPVLERLLYKPKSAPVTRVLVLVPTRELAVQVFQVGQQLAQFTNVEISLSAGGLDLKTQEAALRLGPDVVIATPGRLIDHVHNSPNFNLHSIEILILDEADRMLDEYFAEQMKEVIRLCSRTRQTMLFSATMSDSVKDLISVSLNNPVKVFVNENTDVASNLRQEFVRVRPNREGDREALVAALVSRTFQSRCIIFIQTKVQAHRMHIILGLLGIKVGELHGNLSQTQRLEALKNFKDGAIDILLATDVAARGLDIQGVKTVINFTMPNSVKHYIHRVGRTARAGKSGRSVSLVGEKERKLLKEIVKKSKTAVKSRVVPQDVVMKFRDKIANLAEDVAEVVQMEKEEKELRISELQVNRAQNLIQNQKEAGNSVERTWFQTIKERTQEKVQLRLGNLSQNRKKMKKNLTPEDRVEYDLQKAQSFAVREAKRSKKPKRIRAVVDDDEDRKRPASKKKKTKKSTFDKELINTSAKAVKQFRAGPSYEDRKKAGGNKKIKSFKSKTRYKRR